MTQHTGHCLCGAVRFTATDMRSDYGVCHCKMCQRWTGMAFAGLTLMAEQLSVTGSEHVGTWRSSDSAERSFCTRCGSPLWFVDLKDGVPLRYEIAIGLLDDADGLTLSHELFIDRKPDSFALAGEHPRDTEADYFRKTGHTPSPTPTEGLK